MGNMTPVLILSALDDVDERVTGLKAGGDDYLTKPYQIAELTARLQALTRRAHSGVQGTVLHVGDLTLDLIRHKVTRSGRSINLQPREFRLLEYLMQHNGQVVTRSMLLENVWDYHFDPQTNVIDVQISRLRSKIDKDFDSPLLHTVRGAGYKLQEAAVGGRDRLNALCPRALARVPLARHPDPERARVDVAPRSSAAPARCRCRASGAGACAASSTGSGCSAPPRSGCR